jgi:hypothetical protein
VSADDVRIAHAPAHVRALHAQKTGANAALNVAAALQRREAWNP